jgi:hypothetical protein
MGGFGTFQQLAKAGQAGLVNLYERSKCVIIKSVEGVVTLSVSPVPAGGAKHQQFLTTRRQLNEIVNTLLVGDNTTDHNFEN